MIKRGYVECRDGQIHYRQAGQRGMPVVVFLHQTASSGAMFEKVMMRLDHRYELLAFDTPGFGNSYVPQDFAALSYFSDRLIEAITNVGLQKFHLVGHHTGGCIALEIAGRSPDIALSLSLIGPVIASESERNDYRKTFVSPFTLQDDGRHLQVMWDYLHMIGATAEGGLIHREMMDHMQGAKTMSKIFAAVWDQDSENLLKAVRCPLQLMISKDDVLWPIFKNATTLRPEAATCIVEGMDFQPDIDPDGVASGLSDFFSKQKRTLA